MRRSRPSSSSAAAVEGFADYWTAVVFNNTTESDCALDWNTQDFDGDGIFDATGSNLSEMLNCEGKPYWGTTPSYVETTGDHLGSVCDGVLPNRGTEFDWLRLLWDLDSEGMPFADLMEIWDKANPKSWRETDIGITRRASTLSWATCRATVSTTS